MKLTNLLLTCFVMVLYACSPEVGIACTEEFRYITITVNGKQLEECYTIREATGDTLRYDTDKLLGNNVYAVLTDQIQPQLRNKTESFTFKGVVGGTVVVSETFTIKANECHIEYVSGKTNVDL